MIFFKATADETIYEIALTQLLTNLQPDVMPDLIAVDTVRGWMLMRDGGEQLGVEAQRGKAVGLHVFSHEVSTQARP